MDRKGRKPSKAFSRNVLARGVLAAALVASLGACSGGLFGGGDEKATPTIGNREPILSRIEAGAEVDLRWPVLRWFSPRASQ